MSGNAHAQGQGAQAGSSKSSNMKRDAGFEALWADLHPRTVAMLRRRGVPQDVADDVAQESAIRLLDNWALLDPSRPPWPFVRRIALNCLADRYRTHRLETIDELPDRVGPHDVEEESLARARLAEVWQAMGALNKRERSLLLAEVGVVAQHGNDSATKMARHRARQKLTAVVGRSGAFAGVPMAWRRFTGWVHLHAPTYVEVGTAAGLIAIASAAAVSFSDPAHSTPRADQPSLRPFRVVAQRVERTERPSRPTPAERTRPAEAKAAASVDRPSPSPSPTGDDAEPAATTAEAGPARAETGRNGGATYVQLCTGEGTATPHDDTDTTIVIYDGDQDPDDAPPPCRHGEESP